MTPPEITALTATYLIVLQIVLMMSVGLHRASAKVGVGHGEDENLLRKIRRHGNLAENAALFLVALALAEISGAPSYYVTILAVLFVVARTSHALGFTSLAGSHATQISGFAALRAVGAFGTAASGVGVAVLLAVQYLG